MNGTRSTVFVYCQHEFIQESLCQQLASWGDKADFEVHPYNRHDQLDQHHDKEAVLYVDSDGHDIDLVRRMAGTALRHVPWLVLTRGPESQSAGILREQLPRASFCPIDISIDELAHVLILLCKGRQIFIDGFCSHSFEPYVRPAPLDLREDQYRLLGYLGEGLPNKVIAAREGCDEALVKFRVRSLLQKLGVSNRTQAAVRAVFMGLGAPKPAGDARTDQRQVNGQYAQSA